MQNLRISLVQSQLQWENPLTNLDHFTSLLSPLQGQTDLVILPEMFSTAFSMNSQQLAEPMDGPAVRWMQQQAGKLQATICGSLIIQEGGNFYNRLIWMRPDGSLSSYDKRHLFTLAGEQHSFTAGRKRLIVEHKGWKICPLICYDLRFPVFSRNTVGYDLLIYVANWPAMRRHAWQTLLAARAIENQSYTVGVNRVGRDGNNFPYSGDSMLVDFAGELIYRVEEVEDVFTTSLSYNEQQTFRQKLHFLPDRDRFELMD